MGWMSPSKPNMRSAIEACRGLPGEVGVMHKAVHNPNLVGHSIHSWHKGQKGHWLAVTELDRKVTECCWPRNVSSCVDEPITG